MAHVYTLTFGNPVDSDSENAPELVACYATLALAKQAVNAAVAKWQTDESTDPEDTCTIAGWEHGTKNGTKYWARNDEDEGTQWLVQEFELLGA